jgi:hypothetical protein
MFVFGNKYYETSLIASCCLDQKSVREKKIESVFSFLFSTPRSQLPSVKYVYAVDYKSMIGGYRTLLVMNSVNPLLIPLRCLSHV